MTKAKCSKCGDTTKTAQGKCVKCGQICKGVSLNPTGRPKSHNLSQKDRDELSALLKKDDIDIQDIAAWFADRSMDIDMAHKYVKEFLPYIKPKKQSIQSEVRQQTKFIIEIAGTEYLQNNKTIEGEAFDEGSTDSRESLEDRLSAEGMADTSDEELTKV